MTTELGDAVHRLLELVDLRAPAVPELATCPQVEARSGR